MFFDETVTLSLLACKLLAEKQVHLNESGAGRWECKGDCYIIVVWRGVGFFTQPPQLPKNLVCLLSEGLLGAGFNLLGNLLRC